MADNEIEFPKGLIVKAPRDGAPDFVKAAISIKVAELIEWLSQREGEWVNLDVKEAKSGKWYCAVNTYKPKSEQQENKPGANVPASEYDIGDDAF
jgi:hypothetical protein